MSLIVPVKLPKWGLSMKEGKIVHWWRSVGDEINEGEDLLDVETSKITNTAESPGAGVLRRIIAMQDQTVPVGALLAVIADPATPEDEIDRFVDDWRKNFVPEADDAASASQLQLRMVEADGGTLRVGFTQGEGTPIVLLHGFGADLNNWLFNVDALSAAAPVMAIDLPGHGASRKDVGDGSLATMAGRVGAVLDSADVAKAHLVGHSLGAAVAMRLALDQPDRVLSLTLVAPAGLPGSTVSETFLNGFVEADRRQLLKPVLELLVGEPGLISRAMIDDVLKSKRLDGAQEALATLRDRMLEGSDFRALQPRLGELPPTLVIAGCKDAIVSGLSAAALPSVWRLVRIDAAGHMPHVERAGEVNRLILEQIES